MSLTRAGAAAALLAASCVSAAAQLYPAARPGLVPRGVAVVDAAGRGGDLMDSVRGAGPVILLPIFTHCAGTCPILAGGLKSALAANAPAFRVVVLSFDASDTGDDLRAFRSEQGLPQSWTFVRVAQAGAARDFLDQFGYSVMESNRTFVHPSELFVLSAQGRWSGTFAGGSFPPDSLKSAAREAEEIDVPTSWSSARRMLSRPQAWAVLALIGLAGGVAGLQVLSLRASR